VLVGVAGGGERARKEGDESLMPHQVEGGDAGDVWERKQKTSLSQSVKESLREAMLAQTT